MVSSASTVCQPPHREIKLYPSTEETWLQVMYTGWFNKNREPDTSGLVFGWYLIPQN